MTLEELDPPVIAAGISQLVLLILGGLVLWRLAFSTRGRDFRRQPSPLAPWTVSIWDFSYGVVIVIFAGIAGQVGASLLESSIAIPEDFQVVVIGSGFQLGMLAGACIAAASIKQRQIAAGHTPTRHPPRPLNIWMAALITLLALLPVLTAVNLAWTAILEALDFDTTRQELVFIFAETKSPLAILALTSLAVVIAPLTEELIFRAGLFRYLRTRTPDWFAYTLPAVIFALLHGNLVAFGPLFVLGVGFAIAYERTGRIAVPIIAHGLFNLNTVVMLLAGVEV